MGKQNAASVAPFTAKDKQRPAKLLPDLSMRALRLVNAHFPLAGLSNVQGSAFLSGFHSSAAVEPGVGQ
jgi:hypothetical protein